MRFVVDPRRLVLGLAGAVVALNAISLVLRLLALRWDVPAAKPEDPEQIDAKGFSILLRQFNVAAETNVPTWFNVALLLMCAFLLWGHAVSSRRAHERWWRHWAVLAVAFAYLSLDELASLHEKTMPYVAQVVEPRGVLTFGWVVLFAPLAVVFALGFTRFLRRLPSHVSRLMIASGALYVSGAIGMEMVSASIYDRLQTIDTLPYVLATNAEELLEMLGITLFLYAVAHHRWRSAPGVEAATYPSTEPTSVSGRAELDVLDASGR